jgi:osmotically-inducible protein OsmY
VQIQKDVLEEIKWQPDLKLSDIGVSCKNGVVTLSGQVATYSQKVNAEKAAKKVSGVMAVAENIHVGVSAANRKTDAEIAEAALTALKWNSAVQNERIKILVEDSYLTLEGEADSEYQRSQAKKCLELAVF